MDRSFFQRFTSKCQTRGVPTVTVLLGQAPCPHTLPHARVNVVDPDPGDWWPKIVKSYRWKNMLIFSRKLNFLSLGLRNGRPSYRRSLQPSKENIQQLKKWYFELFLFQWVFFALLDPELADQNQWESVRIRIHNTGLGGGGVTSAIYLRCCPGPSGKIS
jgi:hypothetical protein